MALHWWLGHFDSKNLNNEFNNLILGIKNVSKNHVYFNELVRITACKIQLLIADKKIQRSNVAFVLVPPGNVNERNSHITFWTEVIQYFPESQNSLSVFYRDSDIGTNKERLKGYLNGLDAATAHKASLQTDQFEFSKLEGKTVILLNDIYFTGVSIEPCIRQLRPNVAIHVLSLISTGNYISSDQITSNSIQNSTISHDLSKRLPHDESRNFINWLNPAHLRVANFYAYLPGYFAPIWQGYRDDMPAAPAAAPVGFIKASAIVKLASNNEVNHEPPASNEINKNSNRLFSQKRKHDDDDESRKVKPRQMLVRRKPAAVPPDQPSILSFFSKAKEAQQLPAGNLQLPVNYFKHFDGPALMQQ